MPQAAPNRVTDSTILVSTNPARNFEILGEVETSSPAEIGEKVSAARKAQATWQALGLEKRIAYIGKLIPLFEQNRGEFIKLTSFEMGMPQKLSENLVDGAIADLKWNCDHAPECLKNEITYEDDNEINEVVYEPRGVTACIVAWNFPLPNFVISASQALLAGNTMVMKYSEEIPLFSKFLESVIEKAGLPEGVISFVYGPGETGACLADQDIDYLSFTGSFQTGEKLYKKAAEKFIPITLELGGSSPGIVFADCVLDDALIENLFWKRFSNSAQFCDGLKRLIVHNSLLDECVSKLAAYAKTKKIGDPFDPSTELGPLVAERQIVKLESQIQDALDKGAKLHCGGKRPENLQGAYYEPTLLTNISKNMRVWREEVFGPALPVIGFDTYEEAITLANDTGYGLSGFVFTPDKDLARKAMLDLKAGGVSAQKAEYYRSQNPFGGCKHSGMGRQGGKFGFREACRIKIVAREK